MKVSPHNSCTPPSHLQLLVVAEAVLVIVELVLAVLVGVGALRLAGVVGADWYGGQYGLIGGANCPWIHRSDLARCIAHVASGGARFSTADAPLVVGLGGGARALDTAAAAEGAAKLTSSNFEFAYRDLEDAKNDARTAPAVWA